MLKLDMGQHPTNAIGKTIKVSLDQVCIEMVLIRTGPTWCAALSEARNFRGDCISRQGFGLAGWSVDVRPWVRCGVHGEDDRVIHGGTGLPPV